MNNKVDLQRQIQQHYPSKASNINNLISNQYNYNYKLNENNENQINNQKSLSEQQNKSHNFMFSVPSLISPLPLDCVLESDNDLGCLFIGNLDAAMDADILKQNKIRAVLTTSIETGFKYAEETIHFHECLPAHDKEGYDITVHFENGIEFIDRHRKYTSVLVHCFAGVSRSASICVAYLMKIKKWNLEKALWHLKKCRKIINPNVGFIKKLAFYEQYLQSQGHYSSKKVFSQCIQIEKQAARNENSVQQLYDNNITQEYILQQINMNQQQTQAIYPYVMSIEQQQTRQQQIQSQKQLQMKQQQQQQQLNQLKHKQENKNNEQQQQQQQLNSKSQVKVGIQILANDYEFLQIQKQQKQLKQQNSESNQLKQTGIYKEEYSLTHKNIQQQKQYMYQ